MVLFGSLNHLVCHEVRLVAIVGAFFDIIRKEEYLQDDEDDKQLDEDDGP